MFDIGCSVRRFALVAALALSAPACQRETNPPPSAVAPEAPAVSLPPQPAATSANASNSSEVEVSADPFAKVDLSDPVLQAIVRQSDRAAKAKPELRPNEPAAAAPAPARPLAAARTEQPQVAAVVPPVAAPQTAAAPTKAAEPVIATAAPPQPRQSSTTPSQQQVAPPPASAPPPVNVSVAAVAPRPEPPPSVVAPTPAAALKPLARPAPSFPREATRAGVSAGRVLAAVTVAPSGNVTDVRILEATPPRVFDRTVREALSEWRFEPMREPATMTIELLFKNE